MLVSSHSHQHSMVFNFFDLCPSGVSLEFCFLTNELPIVLLILFLLIGGLVFPNGPS